jgi:hemerythrin-like domain-containing protein
MRLAIVWSLIALSVLLLVVSMVAALAGLREALAAEDAAPACHSAAGAGTGTAGLEQIHTQENSMQATDVLRNEHRLIVQVVGALRQLALAGQAEGRIDGAGAADALDFIRNFTDRCHHAKEETLLFPALLAAGLPADGGPVAVMLSEHEQGRAFAQALDASREAAAAGDSAALAQFTAAALGYSDLLVGHIDKEDHVLFNLADGLLSAEQQAQLRAEFDRVEAEEIGEGEHERFHALGEALVARYGDPAGEGPADAPAGCGACGCDGH